MCCAAIRPEMLMGSHGSPGGNHHVTWESSRLTPWQNSLAGELRGLDRSCADLDAECGRGPACFNIDNHSLPSSKLLVPRREVRSLESTSPVERMRELLPPKCNVAA